MAAYDDDGADFWFFLLVLGGAYLYWQSNRYLNAATGGGGDFEANAPAQDETEGILNILIPLQLSPTGRDFIKANEGFRANAYADGAGHQSIGYGHQIQPGETFQQPISQATADRLFNADAAKAAGVVSDAVAVELSQDQFDALVDFCFNVGAAAFRGSTLLRLLNSGDYAGAAQQFNQWVKSGGATRRVAETNLFESLGV